jgi:hypothetical protein
LTAEEHNKFVGYAHLGYAVLHVLLLIVTMSFMGIMLSDIFGAAERMGGEPPPRFIGVVIVFVGLINVLMTIPSIVAGYALLKRQQWAKVAGIIAAVLAAMSFPIGTAVAVYTFWFLFSETGKSIYDRPKEAPPPPPENWVGTNQTSI